MSHARCIAEPVSWLRLERYVLDELPPAERAAVTAHLSACAACAAAETAARQPLAVVSSPEVSAAATLATSAAAAPTRPGLGHRLVAAVFGTRPAGIASRMALVAASAVVLSLTRTPASRGPGEAAPRLAHDPDRTLAGIKGGDVSVELVRERGGVVETGATTFAAGDRWKVLVTCPSGRVRFWELAVHDSAGVTLPLSPAAPITCGNRVPLPEALRISGTSPNDVCLLLDDAPLDRARITARGPAALTTAAACITLRPEATVPER